MKSSLWFHISSKEVNGKGTACSQNSCSVTIGWIYRNTMRISCTTSSTLPWNPALLTQNPAQVSLEVRCERQAQAVIGCAMFREATSMALSVKPIFEPKAQINPLIMRVPHQAEPRSHCPTLQSCHSEEGGSFWRWNSIPRAHLLFFLFSLTVFWADRTDPSTLLYSQSPSQEQSSPFQWPRAKWVGILQITVPLSPWNLHYSPWKGSDRCLGVAELSWAVNVNKPEKKKLWGI